MEGREEDAMATPRTMAHTLTEVARQLAPNLRIISASQPTPVLRTHNVIGIAESPDAARQAVLALEAIEADDEQLGTVVMATTEPEPVDHGPQPDPEGVVRHVAPRVLVGGLGGGVVGAVVVALGALLLGARGFELVGAALAGAMLVAIFGAMWVTFAGLGGSDAYRQTFVDENTTNVTLVSIHTDDSDEAAAARDRLGKLNLRAVDVDRFGQIG
jgi:hypothetical protein